MLMLTIAYTFPYPCLHPGGGWYSGKIWTGMCLAAIWPLIYAYAQCWKNIPLFVHKVEKYTLICAHGCKHTIVYAQVKPSLWNHSLIYAATVKNIPLFMWRRPKIYPYLCCSHKTYTLIYAAAIENIPLSQAHARKPKAMEYLPRGLHSLTVFHFWLC